MNKEIELLNKSLTFIKVAKDNGIDDQHLGYQIEKHIAGCVHPKIDIQIHEEKENILTIVFSTTIDSFDWELREDIEDNSEVEEFMHLPIFNLLKNQLSSKSWELANQKKSNKEGLSFKPKEVGLPIFGYYHNDNITVYVIGTYKLEEGAHPLF